MLWGEQGTPECQVHLIMYRDEGGEWHTAPIGMGIALTELKKCAVWLSGLNLGFDNFKVKNLCPDRDQQ